MINDNVRLDHVYIGRGNFRNFSGKIKDTNKTGARMFTIMLPEALAAELEEIGWHIRHRPPYREGDDPQHLLDITIHFDWRPTVVTLISYDGEKVNLNEESISILDSTDIEDATVEFYPYNWNVNGKTGAKAILQELIVKAKPPRRSLNAQLYSRDDEPF